MNARIARGAAARLAGRRSEVWAAMWLMAKGYRILGFRLKTPQAEIDLCPPAKSSRGGGQEPPQLDAALEGRKIRQRDRLRRAGAPWRPPPPAQKAWSACPCPRAGTPSRISPAPGRAPADS